MTAISCGLGLTLMAILPGIVPGGLPDPERFTAMIAGAMGAR